MVAVIVVLCYVCVVPTIGASKAIPPLHLGLGRPKPGQVKVTQNHQGLGLSVDYPNPR